LALSINGKVLPMRCNRLAVSLLALLALAWLTVPLAAEQPAGPKPVTTVEGITEYRLDNGLRVLLFPDNSSPKVTVAMTVFVGSRHEGYGETGMAHLLEHMVFKGTPTFPKIKDVLRDHAANFNGTTNTDRTNYFETMAAGDENLEFGIRFETDRLVNSFINREDLIAEMPVVRNEFERGENSPGNVLSQRIEAAAYEWHNYGKSTIGNRSDIERVPIDNLKTFYKKWYQPDNAMLVVAGQFDEKKALQLVQKYGGAIPKPERKLDNTYTEEPPQDGERFVTLRRVGGDVGLIGLAYHVPAGAHPDTATLQVLARILTVSPSGRLYKSLVETKKASGVAAFAQPQHDPGLLSISAVVPRDTSLEEVRDTALKTLDEVATKGVTDEEVKRAVSELLTARERAAANTSSLAIALSSWASQGDWRLYFITRDRLEKVTAADVKAVAEKYLRQNNRTVGFFVPTEKPERVAIPETPDVEKLVSNYKGREDVAQGEAFDTGYDNVEKRTERSKLPDGVGVALLPKKTKAALVDFHLTLRFGDQESLKEYKTAAEFLGPLMTRGTRQHTYQQFKDELDQQKATLSIGTGPGTLTVNVRTKHDNLPKVLGLLRESLRDPLLPEEEFAILKKQTLANLEQRLKDPQALATNKLNRELNPFPKGDYHYQMTLEEEVEATKAVTLDQVKKLYADFVGGQHGELVILGDFDKEKCLPVVAEALAGWKSAKPYARIPAVLAKDVKGGRHGINTPDKANANFYAALKFPLKQEAADYPALVLANYVLGSGPGSRLWDRVREKDGLSYGVGSAFNAGAQDEVSEFLVQAICNPENAGKVELAVLEEITRLATDGVSADELDKAKASYTQREKTARADDARLLGTLSNDLYLGRTMAYHADLEKKIQAVTPDQVKAAFKKYVEPSKLVVVIAGDLEKKPGGGK
jgi:zinc protease